MATKHDLDRELRNFDMRQHHERVEFMSAQISEALRTRTHTDSQEKRGFDLAALLSEAAKQQAGKWHVPVGAYEPTVFIPKPAAVSSTLGLNAELAPDVIEHIEASVGFSPQAAPGAKSLLLSDAVANLSRVVQAGVNLISKPLETEALAAGREGGIALHSRPVSFLTVEPALFSVMLDGLADGALGAQDDGTTNQELSAIALPMNVAQFAFDSASAAPTLGVQIQVPRSMQTTYGRERVAAAALASIVLGLARAVDKAFLSALASAAPALASFSLANAASQGLRFDELRALIGTSGTGAAVDAMGKLRADGILAQLTADAAASYIGSFSRSAIALHQDIPLHIERRDAAGDLLLTCFATMQPLIPDASKFWVAA